jgi:hypothetical protein
MNHVALASLVFGMVAIGFCGASLAAPQAMLGALSRFPRSRPAGWILTCVDLVWSGILLYHVELGRFNGLKPYLWILVPVVVVLVVRHMAELLASRALGGLLILVPAPLLAAARWHPSPFRYAILILAYAMAVKGVVLVLAPYLFRSAVEFWRRRAGGYRAASVAGLLLGVLLTVLAFTAFRAA